MALFQLENVISGYGSAEILHDITLHIERNEVVSLIGPNGAGKSTVFRTISGLLLCRKGKKVFEDRDITKLPGHQIARLGISQVPEGKQVFGSMTVQQNLLLGCYSKYVKLAREGRNRLLIRVFEIFPRLDERKTQLARTLSGGEQQMLAIGRALMAEPKLLLMDEPSTGLGPLVVQEIFRVCEQLCKEGLAILIAEQNVVAALGLASRSYLMVEGRILLHGESKTLIRDQKVKQLYLGGMEIT